jgi:predicted transcriptional regulator
MPNKIDLSKRIKGLISNMDKESLADAVRILGKGKNAKKTVEALESAVSRIDVDFDSVKREALYALNIAKTGIFHGAPG